MDKMTRHGAALTKTRAMRRDLLSNECRRRLLDAPDLEAAFLVLGETGLTAGWRKPVDGTDPILSVETYLSESFEERLLKLYHYYGLAYKRFLGMLLLRFDIETLKMILRVLEDRNEAIFPSPQLRLAAMKHAGERLFHVDLLAQAKTKQDVAAAIALPKYRAMVEQYAPSEPLAQFDLEMRLDREYFRELMRATKALSHADRKLAKELIGENIDLHNLRWITRAKRFYRLPDELIFTYTIADGKVFNTDKLYALCESSLDELDTLLATTPYRFILKQTDDSIPSVLPKYLLKRCHSLAKKEPLSLAPIIAFLHDWEFMLSDLTTILEAKVYGVDPRPYLIGKGLDDGR